jgi:pimeloyl-ACP methyl ester carboxylesterase
VTDVRFAPSGDVHVAYRVVGDGPVDLVYAQGACTHLEVYWELPAFRRYCERLAEFSRLVLFDKRGMGMSDRVPGATTLEERMDDVRAVMDAVGSERAVVMGESEGGPLAMLFAAAHPERTRALILQGAEVRERTDESWPWGEDTPEAFEEAMATLPERWGKGLGIDWIVPGLAGEEWARCRCTRPPPAPRRRSCAWRSTSTCGTWRRP